MKKLKEKILAYALKNALEHKGNAQANAVLNSLFHEGLKKQDVKKTLLEIQEAVKKVNSMPLEKQEREFRKQENKVDRRKEREGLPPLPKAKKGKVIMRFAPSASGPLHIGHILTIVPSFLYVQKHRGKLYIRIEDTNPENIYPPAYKMITEEAKWLCKNKCKIVIQSERIPVYYRYAEKLIEKKAGYICTCSSDRFKKFIERRQNCPCRKLSVKENLDRWSKMLKNYPQGQAILRFKSSMKHKNPAMRDFPLARINLTKHPLQKNKYRVWPLMNLAVTADDIEQKMTHIIRGKDHRDNAERQKMIYRALGKQTQYPWVGFIGRIHFKDFVMSSTQMRKDIEAKKYSGWDDSKLPTASSLKKQGYKPEIFWKFVEQRGISEADKVISKKDFFEVLDNIKKSKHF